MLEFVAGDSMATKPVAGAREVQTRGRPVGIGQETAVVGRALLRVAAAPSGRCWSGPGPTPPGRSASTGSTASSSPPPKRRPRCCAATGRSRSARSRPRSCSPKAAGSRARAAAIPWDRKASLGDVTAPGIAEHGGGIVKTTGGGLAGAFSGVVDARRGAVNAPSAPVRSSLDTNA